MAGKSKLCFVVGPIGAPGSDTRNHADLLLEFIIKPVLMDFPDYLVKRQDEDSKPGMIDSQVITALRDAELVIADLSHLNPNAFYEIGIRHMVAKPVIHMQLEDQRIPFDLSLYKTVPFSFSNPAAYRSAQDMLKAQISEAVANGYVPDNPVTRALGQQHLKQTASPELKVISDTLESLGSRIAMLENDGVGIPPMHGSIAEHYLMSVRYEEGTSLGQAARIETSIRKLLPMALITRNRSVNKIFVGLRSRPTDIIKDQIRKFPRVVSVSISVFEQNFENTHIYWEEENK
jgi:hypothetical protein